jgi:hypothetical protein
MAKITPHVIMSTTNIIVPIFMINYPVLFHDNTCGD